MVRRILFIYLTLIGSILVLSSKTTMAGHCVPCGTCICQAWRYGDHVNCAITNSVSTRCKNSGACKKFCKKQPRCNALKKGEGRHIVSWCYGYDASQ